MEEKIAHFINVNGFVFNTETLDYEIVTIETLNSIHEKENLNEPHKYTNPTLNMFWVERVFRFNPLSPSSPGVLTHGDSNLKIWRVANRLEFRTSKNYSSPILTTINELNQYLSLHYKKDLLIAEDVLQKLNTAHRKYIKENNHKALSR